ncbi:MAG: lytic transglycosylase domain-containing protein [Kofleriaceae bacterium]|nr:lytic transglycosylase domain-containing protein [Kofleriaceae bacterium]
MPTAPAPRGELPRHFDPIFERHRGELPVEYLRALAVRESNMNPGERTGPAWGLLQVIEVVRLDFNKAHGTRVTRAQLLDPETNVRVACWLLNAICASYRHNHPEVVPLRPD